jgi:VanZ family protein
MASVDNRSKRSNEDCALQTPTNVRADRRVRLSTDKKQSMRRDLTLLAAWAWLGFVAFATLSPPHLRPELTNTEPTAIVVFEHVGAYALLGILFSVGYHGRSALVTMIVFASAILLELAQIAIPGRDARLIDAAEKLVGGGIGIAACHLVSLLRWRWKKQSSA